ncbi:MAG: LuxR C-terminal-related transcriptional regulator [Cyanobacteriota bacterium]|nr:LuxR C-terminal-related transcriptional regulator [Cyanobacteriota bacterium]
MPDSTSFSLPFDRATFSQAILESLIDGVAIFSDRGEFVHANKKARSLCQQLPPDPSHPHNTPQAIWQICQALIESRQLFPERQLVVESEVTTSPVTALRLRGRWLQWSDRDSPYLLIALEEKRPSLQRQAISDSQKYGLTPREVEVWSLRCDRYSYTDIAEKLYISENTVKKHLKNINVKRKSYL